MYIPESVLDEAAELLSKDEDIALQRLGMELYSLERQQPVHALTGAIPAQDLRQKATDYLNSKRDRLRNAICPGWRKKGREALLDTSRLLPLIIGLIASALGLSASYLPLAMLVAVILVKRGLDKFCEADS